MQRESEYRSVLLPRNWKLICYLAITVSKERGALADITSAWETSIAPGDGKGISMDKPLEEQPAKN